VDAILAERGKRQTPREFREQLVAALGKTDDPRVAEIILARQDQMEPELRPKAIELLTQRPVWSLALLKAIRESRVSASALNANQIRKLVGSKDPALVTQAKAIWGTVREGRNPGRERVIAQLRTMLRTHPGNPYAGAQVFQKVCGQCHKIYGEGQDVGPEITRNGRGSYDQLLSNVLDPNLVIGAAYQATVVATADGRTLTGLLAEDSPERIVLKTQGGKLETIPRKDVEEMKLSPLSLMPEELEKQLSPEELADLFAYITLDRPPSDRAATPIPGAAAIHARSTEDPAQFPTILGRFAPGFTTKEVGEGGLALLPEHFGRTLVLRTHPVDRDTPCVLRTSLAIPAGRKTRLVLDVSHDPQGDWLLVVRVNGKSIRETVVGPKTTKNGWAELSIDLSQYAGQTVDLELLNQANGWSWEFAHWGKIQIVSE
jgi:putative heme-binding domain-containing protein